MLCFRSKRHIYCQWSFSSIKTTFYQYLSGHTSTPSKSVSSFHTWPPPQKNMISKRVFQVCRAPGKTPCDLDKHWKPFVSRSFGPEQSDHKSYKRSWLRCFDQLIILQVRLLYNPLHRDRQGWNFQRWFEVGLKDKVRKQVQVKETSTIIFEMLECVKEHAYMQYQEEHV